MSLSLGNREATDADLLSSQHLRRQVTQVLSGQSHKQCKLSQEELVMLALIHNTHRWILPKDVGIFILQKIKYFQAIAAKYLFEPYAGHSNSSRELLNLAHKTQTCLADFNLPVQTKLNEAGDTVYSVTVGSAHYFLNQLGTAHLPKHRRPKQPTKVVDKQFPFMRLPTDLRRQIYTMVLQYSGYRLHVDQGAFRAYNDKVVPAWDIYKTSNSIHLPPPSNMLALLSVSKLVHAEAMPEFYRMNHFNFSSCRILKHFLQGIGPVRRKCIASVSFTYSNLTTAPAAAKLLVESEMLHRLTMDIHVTPVEAGGVQIQGYNRVYKTVDGIPGMMTLKKLRGVKELKFGPTDFPKLIEDHLRPVITQPRPKPRVKMIAKGKLTKKAAKDEAAKDEAARDEAARDQPTRDQPTRKTAKARQVVDESRVSDEEDDMDDPFVSVEDDQDETYEPPGKKRKTSAF